MEEVLDILTFTDKGICVKNVDDSHLHLPSKVKAVYVVLGTFSIAASVFLFTTIFSVKKLRAHPSNMIGYICLFEAISCFHSVIWAISTMEYIDYFGLNYVYRYFVTAGGTSDVDSCFALCQLNQIFGYQFFQVMSLGMNICLCIDLILTLQKPFYPAKRRFKFYMMFSFGLAVIMSIISIPGAKETCLTPTSAASSTLQNVSITFILSIYILVSVFSIIYAARMLYRPGMSPELRQIFMKKHLLYAISFIFIWSIQLLNAYAQLYTGEDSDENSLQMLRDGYTRRIIRSPFGLYMNIWVTPGEGENYMQLSALEVISFISSISSGLFMGIIRLMEPYFLFMLKKELYECFGIPYTEEEIKKGDNKLTDTISAFLNSSLNIELVHIILKAISQECTKEDKYLNMDFDYNDRAVYEEQKVHEIKEIIVDDPQKWRLIDATVPKNKRFNFNVLDNAQNDDGSLIINENISVEEFAPRVFRAIRREEGIDNDMIRKSLSPENNRDSVFKAGEGQGKSGSFFFFSHDRKFLIKTMNEEEFETFKKLFKNYYNHLLKNKNSLIARIYGIYTVKKEKIEPVRLILMGNTVNTEGKGEYLKYMFDLKGSFANRKVKMSKNHKASSTLKDINLLEIKKQENILKFTEEDKDRIMSMIYKDVPLLRQANIMDYSLLLAIEQNPMFRENHLTQHLSAQRLTKENDGSKSVYSDHGPTKYDNSFISMRVNPRDVYQNQRHMFLSSDFKFIYHIAIIDYLQDYNYDKKMENLVKTLLKGDSAEISAVPPHRYSTRYMNFMSKEVILTEKKKK